MRHYRIYFWFLLHQRLHPGRRSAVDANSREKQQKTNRFPFRTSGCNDQMSWAIVWKSRLPLFHQFTGALRGTGTFVYTTLQGQHFKKKKRHALWIISTLGSVKSSNDSGSYCSRNALASSCSLWNARAVCIMRLSSSMTADNLTGIGIRIRRICSVFNWELIYPRQSGVFHFFRGWLGCSQINTTFSDDH